MAFKYLKNTPLKDVLALIKDSFSIDETLVEHVNTLYSLNRICAEAIYAVRNVPHYNACAMDGVAVCAKDTFGATDTTPVVLTDQMYKVVDTGDVLPDGFDAVVMVEDVVRSDGDEKSGEIRLFSASHPWAHVRKIGEDVCAGEMIVPSFTKITPQILGALVASGALRVPVVKTPVVGIIPTGDEIIAPEAPPEIGKINEFNSAIFSGMLENFGAKPLVFDVVRDDKLLIKEVVENALLICDVVLINAGSSAGRDDYTTAVIEEVGEVLVHGIAIKPGKPTIVGRSGRKAIVGVPGYPVSGIVVLENAVFPILSHIFKLKPIRRTEIPAVISGQISKSLKHEEFLRMKLGFSNGKLQATQLNRGAGVITSFTKADALYNCPINTEFLDKGAEISVALLRDPSEMINTISVIGSHDPLFDELSDILSISGEMFLSSSHVGSFSGILALKNGDANIAGIHLLDEKSGEYNKASVKKFFKQGEVVFVKGVRRAQGIITQKGNPKNIKSLKDLNDSVRFINRQKGSGTRVLLDFLLKKGGISPESINGYFREEFTHMSVCAAISLGSADCGLGVFSAANAFALDFLKIADEEFDFVISKEFSSSLAFSKFLDVLKSDALKARLEKLGGYTYDKLGQIDESW